MTIKLPGKTNTYGIYVKTALKKGMGVRIIDRKNRLAELSHEDHKIYLYDMALPLNNATSVMLARQKYLAKKLLEEKGIAVARDRQVSSAEEIADSLTDLVYPLVVKPVVGGRGKGITTNIGNRKELMMAIEEALVYNDQILVEEFIEGDYYRFLILNGGVIGIVSRKAPNIIGTGKDTIEELVQRLNTQIVSLNKKNNTVILRKIRINSKLREIVNKQGHDLGSIPLRGEKVFLSMTVNWSTGGSVETLEKDHFHPSVIETAIKTLEVLKLRYAAVDLLIVDPKKLLSQKNGVVLEVNSYPGINIFHHPTYGKPQHVAELVLMSCFGTD